MQSDETAQDLVDKLNTVDIDSSYCATYAPYIQVLDNDSGFNVFLPPTGEVLRVMALTDKISFPWFAPAGTKRGLITKAKQVRKKLSEPERDILYPARINPIAKFNDIGVDIFGQKTLQIKQSVLDRINVRRLLIYSKLVIRQIAKGVLFEPNDDTAINNFLANVNKILTNVQRERGLENFLVRLSAENTPESRDRNEVYFDILLIPTKSIEYIGISFIISPSGVQFNA
jgi:phage tail sheath protein FI